MQSEFDIIRNLQHGSREGFDVLFNRYWKLCYFYFTRVCILDQEVSKELTQEVFLRAYRSIGSFDLGRSFKVWLMAITRNLAKDHSRMRQREHQVKTYEKHVAQSNVSAGEEHVLTKLILEDWLRALPKRQREVFEMKYYWHMKSHEIGEVLGIPSGTVRSDLCFARKRVMDLIQEQEE